jgi:hypothetical protein
MKKYYNRDKGYILPPPTSEELRQFDNMIKVVLSFVVGLFAGILGISLMIFG